MKSRVAWVLPECRLNPQSSVVGYQNKAYEVNGGFTIGVSTFDKVGDSKVSLKDLNVVGGTYADNAIQFLKNNGSTDTYTYTNDEYADIKDYYGNEIPQTVQKMLFYINEDDAPGMECTPGWYMMADYDCIVNMSEKEDFDVKFGTGFFFKPFKTGVSLQYAGEVVQGDSELDLPVNGGFTLTGNCSPVNFDLSNFSVVGGTYADNAIQFLKNNGSTDKYTYTDGEYADIKDYYGNEIPQTVQKMLFYINENDAPGMECTPGWYMMADYDCIVNMSEKFMVKSGEGFFFKPFKTGVKLVVPSAIQ